METRDHVALWIPSHGKKDDWKSPRGSGRSEKGRTVINKAADADVEGALKEGKKFQTRKDFRLLEEFGSQGAKKDATLALTSLRKLSTQIRI